jgi:hypothetical protein
MSFKLASLGVFLGEEGSMVNLGGWRERLAREVRRSRERTEVTVESRRRFDPRAAKEGAHTFLLQSARSPTKSLPAAREVCMHVSIA